MASLLGEIKRRKVFQVAAAYAVVAWLLVQVITAIEAPLSLPDSFDTIVIVALAIGFPIAVIVAWAFDVTPEGIKATANDAGSEVAAAATGQRFGYLIQLLVLIAVGFLVVDQYLLSPTVPVPASNASGPDSTGVGVVRRFPLNIGDRADMATSGHMALAADGRYLIYQASGGTAGDGQLFLRRLDELDARPLEGTDTCGDPFVSPNAEWIACATLAEGRLLRVRAQGGRPQTLIDTTTRPYGHWAGDDSIVFSHAPDGGAAGIFRMSSAGGAVERLTSPEPGSYHAWPYLLPGGRGLLFTVVPEDEGAVGGSVTLLELESLNQRILAEQAFNARYAPSGHIVFARENSLWAVPFDAATLQVEGPDVRVVESLENNLGVGQAPYTFSDDGLLVYEPSAETSTELGNSRFVWMGRDGIESTVPIPPARFDLFTMSPDATRVAVDIGGDIWLYDLQTGNRMRLTVGASDGQRLAPTWWPHPDGDRIVFSSTRPGIGGLSWIRVDDPGQIERLVEDSIPERSRARSVSADGRFIAADNVPAANMDVFVISTDEPSVSGRVDTSFREGFAAISPAGDWMAYASAVSGEQEIYVKPFPDVSSAEGRLISVDEGSANVPKWSVDGRELFYVNELTIMRVTIDDGPTLTFGRPEPLFERPSPPAYLPPSEGLQFGVDSSGERFLILRAEGSLDQLMPKQFVAVENWFEELKRLAPPDTP